MTEKYAFHMNLIKVLYLRYFIQSGLFGCRLKIIFIITRYGKQKRHLIQMAHSHSVEGTNY